MLTREKKDNRNVLGSLQHRASLSSCSVATQQSSLRENTHVLTPDTIIPVLWSRWNLSASGPWRVQEIWPLTPTSGSEAETFSTNMLEGEFSITASVYTSWNRRIITIIKPPFAQHFSQDKYNNTATGLKYIKKKRSFKHLSTGQTSLLELNLKQLISKSRVAFKKGVLRATIRKKSSHKLVCIIRLQGHNRQSGPLIIGFNPHLLMPRTVLDQDTEPQITLIHDLFSFFLGEGQMNVSRFLVQKEKNLTIIN